MVLLANQTVSFEHTEKIYNPDTQRSVPTTYRVDNVDVHIYQAAAAARTYPFAIAYDWSVIYDNDLVYPDSVSDAHPLGMPVLENDDILWNPLIIANGRAKLHKPMTSWGPFIVTQAFFTSTGE